MNVTKIFATALMALPLVASVAGCEQKAASAESAPQKKMVKFESVNSNVGKSTYKITLDGKTFGRGQDVICFSYEALSGRGGLSCDWDGAGPKAP